MSQKKKTITISEERHSVLSALRKKNETFDGAVGRLLESYSSKPEPEPKPLLSGEWKALEVLKKEGESLDDVIERLLKASRLEANDGPNLELMASYISGHDDSEALVGTSPKEAAQSWASSGFKDAFEVKSWLEARCFNPSAAAKMKDAGVTPVGAAIYTYRGDYTDTLGYKFANGDLDLEEIKQVVACHI